MGVACHNASAVRHEIADGERKLELRVTVDWGDNDLRDSHEKPMVFCSFACLSEWAGEKAVQHDSRTVTEAA